MSITRKQFLSQIGSLAGGSILSSSSGSAQLGGSSRFKVEDDLPRWKIEPIAATITHPVMIKSLRLVKAQQQLFVLITDQENNTGIAQCNDRMQHLLSIMKGLVIPHFVNQDARNLEQLVDNAYRLNSNYKYAGMPLWNCIGSVEIATWDLLGKVARRPVYEFLGRKIRSEYDVYISDFNREGDPAKLADDLLEKITLTGASGVKIKVGGRMMNTPDDSIQTRRFVPAVRKRLGDKVTIYADANGSYTSKEGVEVAKFLQDHKVAIFEEPCNFEDEAGTRLVSAAADKLRVAGGEQDSSLYRFKRLAESQVYHILQPDVYYNGGILRTLHVSKIANSSGAAGVAPHTPKADPLIGPFWMVAAVVSNLYGLQEFVFNPKQTIASWHTAIKIQNGKMKIPAVNGLGIEYDESIWKSPEVVIS